jgi:uncharacterized phage protein gp47/JayE
MTPIPTLASLYSGILADLEAQLTINIPLFGKIFLRALAAVQAGKIWLLYKALGNVQKNIFVDTADPESTGGTLERFGRVKLNRNPFPARAGQYTVTVTGSIGAVIPAQTTFKSNDDSSSPGKIFVLDNGFAFVGTSGSVVLRALEAGVDARLSVGDELTATAPIASVDALATVTAESIEPAAAEDLEDYRQKAIDAYRLEPQGGAASDYRIWASDAQGVEKVYAYAKSGVSAVVDLYVEATIADSTDGKGTPSAALLEDVETVVEFDPDTTKPLNERGRRPLGVFDINFLPVTIKEIDITIASFAGITPAIESLIEDAITEALALKRPFVAGADVLADRNDVIDTNNIIAIILNARPGSVFGAITLEVDGTPLSTYTFIDGNIPHLNSISYT